MNVLVYAHEVGSANAIVPVARGLQHDALGKVRVFASGNAQQKFREAAIDHEKIDLSSLSDLDEAALAILKNSEPDVLLSGAAGGQGLDRPLTKAASGLGVPSVALLDMWSNYSVRFTDPNTGEMSLPSRIAVMDDMALDEATANGLPKDRLAITGQPHLEYLASRRLDRSLVKNAAILRKRWIDALACSNKTKIILFASEAFARDFGPETPLYRGYTEYEALEGVASATQAFRDKYSDYPLSLVVKLHPEEDLKTFRMGPSATGVKAMIADDASAWECLMAADAVVGMTSMLLMESVILGRPTLSFQPGVTEWNSEFVGTRLGLIPAYSTSVQLTSALKEAIKEKSTKHQVSDAQPVPAFMRPGAARRVIDLLQEVCLLPVKDGVAAS